MMRFIACGLNHKTAPLAIREKIAPSPERQALLLEDLLHQRLVDEALILTTCNRTELYCIASDYREITRWLAEVHHEHPNNISPYIYAHRDEQALEHCLKVASGLDSMMLGEPQILGQLKQSYTQACELGAAKQGLRPILEHVFSASKRIRHESGVGTNPISVAYAGVSLIQKSIGSIDNKQIMIIGSGETATLVAKYLQAAGMKHPLIASRTPEHAHKLASQFGGEILPLGDIPMHLPRADILITATTCPVPFVSKSLMQQSLDVRQKDVFILDLAVPRDVEADVAELNGVTLFNVDDLHQIINKGMDERKQAAIFAEKLVEYEVDAYMKKHRSRQSSQLICHYREQMQILAEQELHRSLQLLKKGEKQEDVLYNLTERLLNKLMHQPTLALREAAASGDKDIHRLAQYLYQPALRVIHHEEIA